MKIAPLSPGPLQALLSWTMALAAAWLAVGTQPWYQTLLIAALGVLFLLFPPAGSLPRPLVFLSCLLLALAATAFLPGAWFDAAFRKSFQAQGIVLPWTYSPQPWWTWEDLTLLVAGLLWTWNCFESKLSLDHRQFLLDRYLLGLGLVAVATIFGHFAISENLPAFVQGLGQFANRNQTGDVLVMGAICSLAHGASKIEGSKIGRKRTLGILWLILTLIFLIAIILNGSRAALALFAIGLLFLFGTLPREPRRRAVTGVLLVLVLIVGTLIFASQGGDLQSRFTGWLNGGKEGRFAIYQDAAAMVKLYPWIGVGLGNFEGVFNTMRVSSADQISRNIHPDSDWFWIATELGLGGVVIVGLMTIVGFRVYLLKDPLPSLTRASIAVAAIFLIHSLFDVGGHRMGTAWSCLYLVGLGASRPSDPTDRKIPKLFLRLAGLLLLTLALFRGQSMSLTPWMPTRGSLTFAEDAWNQNLPSAAQKSVLDHGLSWAPLDWLLYYQRGVIRLDSQHETPQSEGDFNRALYLEQNSVELPVAIGEECVHSDFPEAMQAWRQLLQRPNDLREGVFEELTSQNLDEKERYEISTLAGHDPELQAIAILHQDSPDFDWYLQNLLNANPSLRGLSKTCLSRLLDRWVEVGDVEKFVKKWPLHPAWKTPGWKAYARALAKTGHEREAVTTALHFMPAPRVPDPTAPPDLDNAANQFQTNPQDTYRGILLYFAQKSKGLDDQAFDTLVSIAKLPDPPSYIRYLLAQDLLQTNQDKAAWEALEPVLDVQ